MTWRFSREHALLRESFGAPVQRLTARECRQAEPMLGPAIGGGLLVSDDASVDPRLLTAALAAAFCAAGGTLLRQPAARLREAAGRAAGADLADGTVISAGADVLSAGWASASLPGLPPGTLPPLRPVKGQILRLRPTPAGTAGPAPAPCWTGPSAAWSRARRFTWYRGTTASWWSARPRRNWVRTPRSRPAASGSCCATPARSSLASPSWSWPRRSLACGRARRTTPR